MSCHSHIPYTQNLNLSPYENLCNLGLKPQIATICKYEGYLSNYEHKTPAWKPVGLKTQSDM